MPRNLDLYYIVYWGYIGIMEKNGNYYIAYWGYIGNNGKENGNYYIAYWGYMG